MIDKFEMLIALAQEKHFGRAAEHCGVTQPSLSSAIRALEETYGAPLVLRSRSYLGLTPEGERVLARARVIVAEAQALKQDMQALASEHSGPLRIGVIPTALALVAPLARPFLAAHPKVRPVIRSMSSDDITEALADSRIDLGLTYAPQPPARDTDYLPLYRETWCAVVPAQDAPAAMDWPDLARHKLCLLTPEMQNRRHLDAQFAALGLTVTAGVEANSLLALLSHLEADTGLVLVLPEQSLQGYASLPALRVLPLPEAGISPEVGLLLPSAARQSLMLTAFLKLTRQARSTLGARIAAR